MNIFNIENTFKRKKERGWDTIYWVIDAHQTIFPGKYDKHQDIDVYPGCLEVLKWISDRPDHKIILWTSSYRRHVDEIVTYFRDKHGITFDFFNENPECKNTDVGDFNTKFYFNIGLDDKFGFCAETDWMLVKQELIRIGEWNSPIEKNTIFYPRLRFYMERGIYKYIEEDCSREAYDTLAGYVGLGKINSDYENWRLRVEERNRRNKNRDGVEELRVNQVAVLNTENEREVIKQIESDNNFVKWLADTETD